jgi:hypothetical protein
MKISPPSKTGGPSQAHRHSTPPRQAGLLNRPAESVTKRGTVHPTNVNSQCPAFLYLHGHGVLEISVRWKLAFLTLAAKRNEHRKGPDEKIFWLRAEDPRRTGDKRVLATLHGEGSCGQPSGGSSGGPVSLIDGEHAGRAGFSVRFQWSMQVDVTRPVLASGPNCSPAASNERARFPSADATPAATRGRRGRQNGLLFRSWFRSYGIRRLRR